MSQEPDFAFADAQQAFGLNKPEYVDDLARITVREGKIVRTLWEGLDHETLPPAAWLLGWPNTEAGLLALIVAGRDGKGYQFVECWPFAARGVVHRIAVDRVHSAESGVLGLIDGVIRDVRLTAFDTFCGRIGRGLEPGDTPVVRLHAWAVSLKRRSPEPVRIRLADLDPSTREVFEPRVGPDGMLTIRTEGMAAIMPAAAVPCPLHQLRSPVKAVRLGAPVMGMAVWVLTVALARPDEQDLDAEVSVTSGVWNGPAPSVGDDVEGLIWLQASFD